MIEVNDIAPLFSLERDDGTQFSLEEHRGKRVLLVFYPADNTPVCTRQLCDYRDGIEAFAGLGVEVVGISADGPASHREFREKHQLPFMLLTDAGLEVAQAYGAKGMLGMKRAVFLVDETGLIRYAHVEALAVFRRNRQELLEVIGNLD